MIPKFPEFKRLEFSDKPDIERITSQYDPYSDFNFACLWSWDIKGEFKVSELNNNLVVVLTDHFTDQPFYSFLGSNEINKTLKKLFAFSDQPTMKHAELRLVPEVSLQDIDLAKFIIEIDLNNYDYIYDLKELSTYAGPKYGTKRNLANNFMKNHPSHSARIVDLSNMANRNEILSLSDLWTQNKAKQEEGLNLKKELIAIERFLNVGFSDTLCVGVFSGGSLVGYSLFSVLSNQYAICHFSKINVTHNGVNEYLMKESSRILLERDCSYLNYEEDLGLPGLRFSKNSFKPSSFLRKYFIKEI